jgi:arylsulfatase A-like enzyme
MGGMRLFHRRPPAVLAAVTALLAVAVSTVVASTAWSATGTGSRAVAAAPPPNIVFVLVDDLSWNLVQFLPQVQQLQRDGVTFTNYTVTDSLCCPSRSSIFTGKFPHDTGVFTNGGTDGGFGVFKSRGNESRTYATALQARGYATAMMGKYLNGYLPADTQGGGRPYVPPGWTEWDVAGNGYPEYNYDLNENHTVVHYGSTAADYLTDVVADKGSDFIRRNAAAGTPFALEIATFAPHAPFTPAKQDLDAFPGLTAPRTAAFNTLPSAAPAWLAGQDPLTAAEKTKIDTDFRKRAQSVQAVDRMIAQLRATLAGSGVADNTYLVFSSDNGFHLGEYRLPQGKQTAFDTDIRVPLVVAGPDVPAGGSRAEIVQNIDLAPTFQRLAGGTVAADVNGRSLVPLLRGQPAANWRTASLIEHHGPNAAADDPDAQTARNGNPTTYEALRTAAYTYVEYTSGEREYYDRVADPFQLHNIAAQLPASRLAALHTALQQLQNCHTHDACWTAGHVTA